MANETFFAFVSGQSSAGTLTGTEIVPLVNAGATATVKSTASAIGTYVSTATLTWTNKTFDTAGTGNVLKINGTQVSAVTGTGSAVLATSPTLVTPTIGVATATTVNKVTLTAPATGSTLTIADGKTLTVSNSGTLAGGDAFTLAIAASKTLTVSNTLTFTGTDSSSVAFGAGGTVAYTNVATLSSLTSVGTIGTGVWQGTVVAPAFGGTGIANNAASTLTISGNFATTLTVTGTTGVTLPTSGTLAILGANTFTGSQQLTSGTSLNWNGDTFLFRDAANSVAQRNSTTAQTHIIYGTYTDASNYEKLVLSSFSGANLIQSTAAGTGTVRPLAIYVGPSIRWQFETTGHLSAGADNSYDIGQAGSVRPRNIYSGTSILTGGATGGIGYNTGAGGTVTQATSKTTAFTLSKITGQITVATGALVAGATAGATWTNTAIAATDTVVFSHVSGGTLGAYHFNAACAAGSATFNITNITASVLTETPVVQFAVIKGVTS